jgi:hypothetical protein
VIHGSEADDIQIVRRSTALIEGSIHAMHINSEERLTLR